MTRNHAGLRRKLVHFPLNPLVTKLTLIIFVILSVFCAELEYATQAGGTKYAGGNAARYKALAPGV